MCQIRQALREGKKFSRGLLVSKPLHKKIADRILPGDVLFEYTVPKDETEMKRLALVAELKQYDKIVAEYQKVTSILSLYNV